MNSSGGNEENAPIALAAAEHTADLAEAKIKHDDLLVDEFKTELPTGLLPLIDERDIAPSYNRIDRLDDVRLVEPMRGTGLRNVAP